MTRFSIFVGIDVAKARLDVHCLPGGETFAVANDKSGRKALLTRLRQIARGSAIAVGFEASGGYEQKLGAALVKAGLACFRLDAAQVRSFARARRQRAKTDALDAALIAQALAALHEELPPFVPDPQRERLAAHLRLRERQIAMTVALKAQLETLEDTTLRRMVTRQIKTLEALVLTIEKAMREIILADAGMAGLYRRLLAAPGVGPILATTLIARLGELGRLSSRAVAAMAGLAPYDRQSGAGERARHCSGGRPHVRRALYMAALAIVRMKKPSPIKNAYQRLRNAGKPFKVAIVATMRKLIVALNAMVAQNAEWKIN